LNIVEFGEFSSIVGCRCSSGNTLKKKKGQSSDQCG
jgi:hypothetical protein